MVTRAQFEPATAARLFQVLSDPTRLEIIWLLAYGERCVCDLQEALQAAQSRLSFHLKMLKTAGLVTDRKDGRWVYYALDAGAIEDAGRMIRELAPLEPGLPAPNQCCG